MESNSRIFVAGHRGLVGSAITRALKNQGFTNLLLAGKEEVDLRNQAAVDGFFKNNRPQHVFLAAARVGGIIANSTRPAEFIGENLLIQSHVIDAARKYETKKLLFLGSSCIYPRMAPQPMSEEDLLTGPLEPTNQWYAVAKIAGIKMCQAYRRQYGLNAISLMPTNIYGPHDNFDLMHSHLPPALIRKFHLAKLAAQGDEQGIRADEATFGPIPDEVRAYLATGPTSDPPPVVLWGSGTPRREFLHVDDLAGACLFCMQYYDEEPFLNVGVGEDLTVGEMAEVVRRVVGFSGTVTWNVKKPDGPPRKLLNTSKLQVLGFKPQIDLETGIRQTYRWYTRQAGKTGG